MVGDDIDAFDDEDYGVKDEPNLTDRKWPYHLANRRFFETLSTVLLQSK